MPAGAKINYQWNFLDPMFSTSYTVSLKALDLTGGVLVPNAVMMAETIDSFVTPATRGGF